MGSTYKFPSGLNNWIDSDQPERMDFVDDNEIIDENVMWKEYYDPHGRELEYQPKEESALQTTVKNVPGAINELSSNKRDKTDNVFYLNKDGSTAVMHFEDATGNSTRINSTHVSIGLGSASGGSGLIINAPTGNSHIEIGRSGNAMFLQTEDSVNIVSRANNAVKKPLTASRIVASTDTNNTYATLNPVSLDFHAGGNLNSQIIPQAGDLLVAAPSSVIFRNAYNWGAGIPIQASAFNVYSSKAVKENIKELQDEVWERLKQIVPYQYNYVWDEDRVTQYGFIADYCEEIAPELVVKDKETGDFLGFNNMGLIAPLLEQAVKQEERIDKLEKQVTELLEK